MKNKKSIIISFIVGVIISGGIVYAAVSAGQIDYTTSKNVNITNVEEALNDLYKSKKNAKLNIVEIESLKYDPRTNSTVQYWGTKTIDVKDKIANYSELTKDNFILKMESSKIGLSSDSDTGDSGNAVFTIDSYENGIVTINLTKGVRSSNSSVINFSLVACYISYE